MTWHEHFRDAAFATNIPTSWTNGVAGYVNGGDAFHPWAKADWQRFPKNRKLPIFVQSFPNGPTEGEANALTFLKDLFDLGVPRGKYIAVDVETAKDPAYVTECTNVLEWAGFYPILYGSASTVFDNIAPRYWVADYAGIGPFMYNGPAGSYVMMTQYQEGKLYDSSTVRWIKYLPTGRWWI